MKGFLDYVPGDSFLHRMNPAMRLLLAVALCASCFVSDNLAFVAGVIALSLGLSAVGGLLPRTLSILKKLCVLCTFLFLLQVFFVRQGQVLLRLPLGVVLTDEGLRFSALICLRLIGATLPLTIMISLTQMSELTHVLVEQLHIPFRYAFALTTAIRFIPVLAGEMADIMEAQTARGVAFDGGLVQKIKLLLPLCGCPPYR